MVEPRDVFEFAMTRAQYEHSERSETWKQLDAKAQATATIAGVFIAASFAFIRDGALRLGGGDRALLLIALLSLLSSVALSVLAMRIREVSMPSGAADTGIEAQKILETALDDAERSERFVRQLSDAVRNWSRVNDELRIKSDEKARYVYRAQVALLVAGTFITLLVGRAIFSP